MEKKNTTYIELAQAQRVALAGDDLRPLTHYLPPAGWLNDPNGLIHWRGEYHLFYQHNPYRGVDGRKFWGHAASHDLLHWRDWPIALTPGALTPGDSPYGKAEQERPADYSRQPGAVLPEEVDSEGAWTGCSVDDHGTPTLVYTARPGEPEWVCLATSRDGLLTWRKEAVNPVIAAPPDGLHTTGFRDPYVWQEGDGWAMVVGSGTRQGGMALLYRSPDLHRWEYAGPLLEGQAARHGEMWECPNFFPLSGKHVLIVSVYPRVLYFTGQYDGQRLHVEAEGQLDWGGDFYAPQTFADEYGRRILFGWSWEGRSEAAQLSAGWAGVLTHPRLLSLGPGGELCSALPPEVEKLRGTETRWKSRPLPAGETALDLQGDCLEILAEFAPGEASCGLKVLASPDGTEYTEIGYKPSSSGGQVFIDRSHASLSPEAKGGVFSAPLKLDPGQALRLHVTIDRSIVEVFANGCASLTTRVYPTLPRSTGVGLFAEAPAHLVSLKTWPLKAIWPAGK